VTEELPDRKAVQCIMQVFVDLLSAYLSASSNFVESQIYKDEWRNTLMDPTAKLDLSKLEPMQFRR
jgi:hypothetical protein